MPIYGATYFNATIKGLGIALLLGLFAIHSFFQKNETFALHSIDLCWLGLIAWTGVSSFWAVNEVYALYGFFSTLLLYGCYKVFESIEWDSQATQWLIYALLAILLMAYVLQFYILRGTWISTALNVRDDDFANSLGEVNHHWMGSLIIGVLPFLLFRKGKKAIFISILLLGIAYVLTEASDSAQVMLALIFLTIGYIIYQAKLSLKQAIIGGVGLLLIGSMILFYLYESRGRLRGIFFVIDEFYQQSDRLWMWANSWQLFVESPLTGIGKNNWALMIGEFGYNGCSYCSKDEFIIHRFKHAHNALIQTTVELGIPGLILYASIGISSIIGYIKNRTNLSNLQLASLTSLSLFLFLSMMYGIVYNYYDHFQGLPVLAVACLAILNKGSAYQPIFRLNANLAKGIFLLLSIFSLFYFYNFKKGFNSYQIANQSRITGYNLGQAEHRYSQALNYWHPTPVYEKMAALYQNLGYPDLRLATYKKAVGQDPNNLLLRYDFGILLFNQGYYKEATKEAEAVYKKAEKYLPNKLLLIKSYIKTGEVDSAKTMGIALQKKLDRFINPDKYQKDSLWTATVGLLPNTVSDSIIKSGLISSDSLGPKPAKKHNPRQEAKQYNRRISRQNTKDKKASILNELNSLLENIELPPEPMRTKKIPQFLTLATIEKLKQLPNHSLFVIDAINGQPPHPDQPTLKLEKDKAIGIRGWAVDNYSQELAGGIFIELAGEFYRANYRQERADVAKAHGIAAYKKCGFSCSIPVDRIRKGEYEIKVWILKNDGSALLSPPNDKLIKIVL